MGLFRPDLTGSRQMTSSIGRTKEGACIIRRRFEHITLDPRETTRASHIA